MFILNIEKIKPCKEEWNPNFMGISSLTDKDNLPKMPLPSDDQICFPKIQLILLEPGQASEILCIGIRYNHYITEYVKRYNHYNLSLTLCIAVFHIEHFQIPKYGTNMCMTEVC